MPPPTPQSDLTMPAIRQAVSDDARAIADIHVQAWRETYAGLLPKSLLDGLSVDRREAWWRTVLDGTVKPERAVYLAADDQERTVGFSCYGPQRNPELDTAGYDGEIEAIYLLDDAKRQGTGRRLMETMAAAMLADGYKGAALWVLSDNNPARRFYEALGGSIISKREERRSDDLVLQEVAYGWRDLGRLAHP